MEYCRWPYFHFEQDLQILNNIYTFLDLIPEFEKRVIYPEIYYPDIFKRYFTILLF